MDFLIAILKKLNLAPVPLLDMQPQMCRTRAILEANNLGIFETLEDNKEGLSSEELAQRVAISSEGAAILLNALEKTGYLRSRKGRYKNSPWVNRWITDPQSGISNFLRLQLHTWNRLSDIEVPLRTGKPVMDFHKHEVPVHSEQQEIYTKAMREISRRLIPEFLKKVKLPNDAKRLLDIGGAHGEYSHALVRKFPSLKATVLDLAGPIATAKRILDKEGNPEAIEFIVGDFLKDNLGTGWDAVLLVNIVHLFNFEQNRKLISRIHEALSPQGVIIVVDQFMGIGRLQDKFVSLISLNYFTLGGKCYHLEEMRQLFKTAGFNRIMVKPFRLISPTVLFEGWKDGSRKS